MTDGPRCCWGAAYCPKSRPTLTPPVAVASYRSSVDSPVASVARAFKRAAVQRIVTGEKTVAELSRELDIVPSVTRSWNRFAEAGVTTAVQANEDVVPASHLREAYAKIRNLERTPREHRSCGDRPLWDSRDRNERVAGKLRAEDASAVCLPPVFPHGASRASYVPTVSSPNGEHVLKRRETTVNMRRVPTFSKGITRRAARILS